MAPCEVAPGRSVSPYRAYEESPGADGTTWAFAARDGEGRTYTVGGWQSKSEARAAAEWQRRCDEGR